MRPLGSLCVLPGRFCKPGLFKQICNPAQVFSAFAKTYAALIKVAVFLSEHARLPAALLQPHPFLSASWGGEGFPGSLCRGEGELRLVHQKLNWKPVPSLACFIILLNSTSCSHKSPWKPVLSRGAGTSANGLKRAAHQPQGCPGISLLNLIYIRTNNSSPAWL